MEMRIGLVALFGLTGSLLGCGDDEATRDTSPATTASSTTVTPQTSTPPLAALLGSMLLDTSDVDAGWQLGPPVTDADLNDAVQIPCPDVAINPTIADRLRPVTGVQFEPVDDSSMHLIEFAVTGRLERLGTDLQVLFDAMDACAATTPTTIGAGSLTVERLTVPDFGDQRAAFTLIGAESPDVTWLVRNAYVRVRHVVVQVGLTEILPTPDDEPTVSDDKFVQLVETAVAKLDGANPQLANPASVYCVEQGGRVDIVDEPGGQVGYCELPDGRRIEEWEFFGSRATTTTP